MLKSKITEILIQRKKEIYNDKLKLKKEYSKRWKHWRRHLINLYKEDAIDSEPEEDVKNIFIFFK